MQRLEIEDQIQLAHVLEQSIQGFHEDLNQIQECKRRLGGGGDEDEVERGVVAVGHERWSIILLVRGGAGGSEERWEWEEVAAAGWSGRDKGEDLGNEALLDCCVLQPILASNSGCITWELYKLRVEFRQTWLSIIVEHQYCVDHLVIITM